LQKETKTLPLIDDHHDEVLWEEVKEIVRGEGINEKDGDNFWRRVMHTFKRAHPHHHFKRKAEIVAHIFVATNYKR
jgi:hypothetical protein